MNIADFPDDSETSDEDYTPDKSNAELPSEEESDGDCEDILPETEELGKRGSKRKKRVLKSKKKLKSETEQPVKQVDKKESEDLWASFKQDTGFISKGERRQVVNQPSLETSKEIEPTKTKNAKVKVTEILKFAGEEIHVEKEVNKTDSDTKVLNKPSGSNGPKPRSGLSSVLNQLGKKTKINTLEKSKLDWDKFKKEEQIEDELSAYSKSKDGYLERQDFLQRADVRRFEIEKNIRNNLRSNRVNNFNI
ncbi:hypothetical protein RN001_009457 [Aquatica leii]|uniref:Craniofacial development protein 1 n=1 Tax=Aquatica leii TaxID=1421715 RepID=A0AAN7P8S9_9COLE|nr:hypothetical protein RN001_009457 [Aquatica leii]